MTSGRGRRFAMGSALLTAAAMAVAGCSSGSSTRTAADAPTRLTDTSSSSADATTPSTATATASTASSASSAPATSAPSSSAAVSQTTGGYLKTLLPQNPTESMLGLGPSLPAPWTAEATDEKDSGDTATAPAPTLVSTDNCDYLTAKAYLDLAGGLSVATASESVSDGRTDAGLALYAYDPGDAAKSLAQVRQNVTSTCDTFTALVNLIRVRVNVSATPVSGLGDEALLIKTVPQGAYIEEENLLVRRGNQVLSLWSSDLHGDFPDLSPVAAALVSEMG